MCELCLNPRRHIMTRRYALGLTVSALASGLSFPPAQAAKAKKELGLELNPWDRCVLGETSFESLSRSDPFGDAARARAVAAEKRGVAS